MSRVDFPGQRSGAVVDRAILDKQVVVGQGAMVGSGPFDDRPNKQEPSRLNSGITVVGKRSVVPRGTRVGRNVKVAADVRSSDFTGRVVRSGESVDRKRPARASRTTGTAAEPANGSVAVGAVSAAPAARDKKVVDAS